MRDDLEKGSVRFHDNLITGTGEQLNKEEDGTRKIKIKRFDSREEDRATKTPNKSR